MRYVNTRSIQGSAPGRVNLIGEHTDYTGGLVLPMAIPFETVADLEPATEGYFFGSTMFQTSRNFSENETMTPAGDWTDYPAGVLQQLLAAGIHIPSFRMHFRGNVPLGAGLSSSASIEVVTAVTLLRHAASHMDAKSIALLCQRAENQFVGSPCGIMDQFVVTAATRDHALLIDTRDLESELLPLDSGDLAQCSIVIANSMVRHSVAGGEYGTRRRELEEGQTALRENFTQVRDLRDATLQQLAQVAAKITPEAVKRCTHVITENARVLQAREAMLAGDATALGIAMTASHASQRDDFEDSVPEIDTLVNIALTLPGCYGARLTGGGFGGCTVNLVLTSQAAAFSTSLADQYKQAYGFAPEIYQCKAVDGAVARASLQ
jgi:galactokinase